MNHYPRHIGDIAKDTAHLSQGQFGAYDLLMDWYYAHEKPLPLDKAFIYAITRARDRTERANTDAVLAWFFTQEDDGWHQKRCDEEVEKYKAKADHNRTVGILGGRPKKTRAVIKENPEITQVVSETEPENNPSHKPVTNNQEKTHTSRVSPAGSACKAMRAAGMAAVNPSHPGLVALVEAGVSEDQFRVAALEAVQRGKPFGYALGIIEGQLRDAAKLSGLKAEAKAAEVYT